MVSSTHQSVFLSQDRYLCCWTISPDGIINSLVSVSITGSIPLLLDYQSRWYHQLISQCFYHWIDTSAAGLLVPMVSSTHQSVFLSQDRYLCCWTISPDGIINSLVSVSITGSIPLLLDYQSRWYHQLISQCFYHWIDTSAAGLLVPMVSSTHQSVFLSLDRYLCCWTISPDGIINSLVSVSITGSIPLLLDYQSRWYHQLISQCFYHWIDTSAAGLLVPMVSSTHQSVFLSLDRYLCCWTISPDGIINSLVSVSITGLIPLLLEYQSRWYHLLISQCFYHRIDTSAAGLLVPMVSSTHQSVFLSQD